MSVTFFHVPFVCLGNNFLLPEPEVGSTSWEWVLVREAYWGVTPRCLLL